MHRRCIKRTNECEECPRRGYCIRARQPRLTARDVDNSLGRRRQHRQANARNHWQIPSARHEIPLSLSDFDHLLPLPPQVRSITRKSCTCCTLFSSIEVTISRAIIRILTETVAEIETVLRGKRIHKEEEEEETVHLCCSMARVKRSGRRRRRRRK